MPTGEQHEPGRPPPRAADEGPPAAGPQLPLSDEVGRVAVGGGTTLAGSLIGKVLGLAGNVLLSHLLGACDFGLWSLARSVVGVGEVVGGAGLPGGVARFTAIAYGDADGARLRGTLLAGRRLALVSGLLATVAMACGAPWIALHLFHNTALTLPICLLATTIVLTALTMLHQGASNGLQAMHYLVLTRDLALPGGLVLVAAAVWVFGGGLTAVLLGYVLVAFLTMWLAVVLATRLVNREAGPAAPLTENRRLLLFSLPLMLTGLANFGANCSDRLIVGARLGPQETAYYVAALQWSSGVTLVLAAYAQVFGPAIARIHHQGRLDELAALLKALTAWVITLSLPVGVLMVLLAEPLMQAFGPGFVSARLCLIVVTLAALVNAGTGPVGIMVVMSGRPGLESVNVVIAAVLTVLLTWVLTPSYGITGAAVATGFTTVLANLMRVVEVRVLLGIHPYSRQSAKPVLAALVATAGALGVSHLALLPPGHLRTAGAAATFLLLYAGCSLLLGVPRDQAPLLADLRRRLRSGHGPATG